MEVEEDRHRLRKDEIELNVECIPWCLKNSFKLKERSQGSNFALMVLFLLSTSCPTLSSKIFLE